MRNTLNGIIFFICLLILPAIASAGMVEVFEPVEEGVSPMALRSQAMAHGFALGVMQEARVMLPGLEPLRAEALEMYLTGHAKPFIQGYKLLSSREVDGGLEMRLDVRIDNRTLRDGLKKLGIFDTLQAPLPASIVWPDDLTAEEMGELQGLVTMTGLQLEDGILPLFTLEYTEEKAYKGRLELDGREWLSINKDMAEVWTDLWSRYFRQTQSTAAPAKTRLLTISGWFSPDGVLEFDRVLRKWEAAVQEAQLVEMDMQPTGVGAVWDVNILNRDRLEMLLQAFLPQRGLTYKLAEGRPLAGG